MKPYYVLGALLGSLLLLDILVSAAIGQSIPPSPKAHAPITRSDYVGLWAGQMIDIEGKKTFTFYENFTIHPDGTAISTYQNSVVPDTAPKPQTQRLYWRFEKGELIITFDKNEPKTDLVIGREARLSEDKRTLILWWGDSSARPEKLHRVAVLPDLYKIKPKIIHVAPSPPHRPHRRQHHIQKKT
jgi:hypothetical protein